MANEYDPLLVRLVIMYSRQAVNPVFSVSASVEESLYHSRLRPCVLKKSSRKVNIPSIVVAMSGSLMCSIC